MTMVEKPVSAEREMIKEEIRAELAHERKARRLRSCGCAALSFFALVIAPLAVAAVIVAKTGLVNVPLLTGWFYRPVAPTKIVQPLVGSTAEAVMKAVQNSAKKGLADNTVVITLKEDQLTTVIGSAIKQDGVSGLPFTITGAQAAILDGQLELYLEGVKDGVKVPVRLLVEPQVMAGRLLFSVKEATMGSLPIPAFMVEAALQKMADSAMGGMSGGQGGGQLTSLRLTAGKMEMTFTSNR